MTMIDSGLKGLKHVNFYKLLYARPNTIIAVVQNLVSQQSTGLHRLEPSKHKMLCQCWVTVRSKS